MTASFDPGQAGWQVLDTSVFDQLIGPVWRRSTREGMSYGLIAADKHGDQNGLVDDGVLSTLLDCALELASSDAQNGTKQAAISLNVQFTGRVHLGDFVVVECQVLKTTPALIFMQGTLRVGDNVCAVAHGTWKLLRPEPPH
jgi:acyl-coenzyme A thioesterase PaaI-like protein